MAPVFSHGDLRLYLLSLLDEGPRHGYDIMQALSDRTGGTYTPSAGTIYPRLAKLEEEGLVTKTVDGRKTVYEITDAGRAEVAARTGDLEGIEAGLTDSVRLIADEVRGSVREAMKSLRADLAAATREERASASEAPRGDDPRMASREQVHRADAAINEFRAQVRSDLRSHVARGGELAANVIDDLMTSLDGVARDITRSLRSLRDETPQN
ncbi:MAG TPA: PadR family transcriptional regulator [Microbacterium sp.]|nr:PadR family transcriptional regulator [Microbacterium sp.]